MSATLTWRVAGPFTKTGTAVGNHFTDLRDLINTKSGDANYKWQVASSNVGSTPYQITLKRKDGSAGRILIVHYSSGAPTATGANSIYDAGSVSVNSNYIAWFPNGNVDTPSNLTAASGTIMGDDTGAVKVGSMVNSGTAYTATQEWCYADSEEACLFWICATGNTGYGIGAGNLVVDASDNAYGATLGTGNAQLTNMGSSTSQCLAWSTTYILAGSGNAACIRTNYGSAGRMYFNAFGYNGWAAQTLTADSWLANTGTSDYWFIPYLLCTHATSSGAKGEGFPLKLRQLAIGPGVTGGPFTTISSTGPVVRAIYMLGRNAAESGAPWLLNEKI